MRKLVLFVLVLVALFVMVGCAKEPTPTPIETDLEVDEIIEVLDGQEYLLAFNQQIIATQVIRGQKTLGMENL